MDNDLLLADVSARSVMSSLPLIRLITAEPIVAELDRRGLPTDGVLDGVGLSREALFDPETFVHAIVMYQFLENAAKAANEHHFLAAIGEQVDVTKWLPMVEVSKDAMTLGDLLTGWNISATEHSTAMEERLDIHGASAVLSGYRSFDMTIVPAQIDGFVTGFLISILRHAMGSDWKPSDMLVTVSDPSALPPIFHGIKAIKGDRRGHKIRFPARWLTRPFDRSDFVSRAQTERIQPRPAQTIVDSIKQALRPYNHEPTLSLQRAAEICNMKPRAFSRLLATEGTNLTTLVSRLKQDFAEEALRGSTRSVADIAADLGYSDPTSFARSFKKWTKVSPREFRRSTTL